MERRDPADFNRRFRDSRDAVNNFGDVQNQVTSQTIGGSVYHGPVYSTSFMTNDHASYSGHQYGTVLSRDPVHRRQQCLDSLRFPQMDTRRDTIRTAHTSTCQWLLQNPIFQDWLRDEKLPEHHGFLWIKGKPGVGKSTILKFAMARLKTSLEVNNISYFFNARGESLEKSTIGMYRSLLIQILDTYEDLRSILDAYAYQGAATRWTVQLLQDLLRNVVQRLGTRSLICIVDALDECEEDETRDMVSFFEDLGQSAVSSNIKFRTLFSSRHYPHITIDKSLTLVLEDQKGHQDDLDRYLTGELKIGQHPQAQEIRQELILKSSGIFLWLVLVIRILNKEYDRGRVHVLRQRLNEIPNDLEALFYDIITRDGPPGVELTLCIQWMLFSWRPLQLQELYSAILIGAEPECVESWNPTTVTKSDMTRFLIHASKGLVEETKARFKSSVQFIHESVRDFFLNQHRLQALSFLGSMETFAARSHDQLRNSCSACCAKASAIANAKQDTASSSVSAFENLKVLDRLRQRDELQRRFPLLSYSIRHMLNHSEMAQKFGSSQDDFLRDFNASQWCLMNKSMHGSSLYSSDANLLYILAAENLPCLLTCVLRHSPTIHIVGGPLRYPLFAAQKNRCLEALQVLLAPWLFISEGYGTCRSSVSVTSADVEAAVTMLLDTEVITEEEFTPLSFSFEYGLTEVSHCLIKPGLADMTSLFRDQGVGKQREIKTPFFKHFSRNTLAWKASSSMHDLLNHSIIPLNKNPIVLSWIIKQGFYGLMELILDQDNFDINEVFQFYDEFTRSFHHETLLHFTLRNSNNIRMLNVLFTRKDLQINEESRRGRTPLGEALYAETAVSVLKLLLGHRDIDPNKPIGGGWIALDLAIIRESWSLIALLMAHPRIRVTPLAQHVIYVSEEIPRAIKEEILEYVAHADSGIQAAASSRRDLGIVTRSTSNHSSLPGEQCANINETDDTIRRRTEMMRWRFPCAARLKHEYVAGLSGGYLCKEPICYREGSGNLHLRTIDDMISHMWLCHQKRLSRKSARFEPLPLS